MAIVQGIAALLLGAAADRLRRRGVGPQVLLGFIATTLVAAQMTLILRLPVSSYLPWSIVAAAGSGPILSYATLAEYFPKEITGRANGALNVFHFGAAFAIQYMIGAVVALWPGQDAHYPAIAYQVAFGLVLALQAAALAWFGFSRVLTHAIDPGLSVSSPHTWACPDRAQARDAQHPSCNEVVSTQLRSEPSVSLAARRPGIG
jgi:MFS family permease